MQTIVYDRSLEGFFTAVFEIYEYRIQDPDIQPEGMANGSLFGNHHVVFSDKDKAARVIRKLQERLPAGALLQLYMAFLSEQPDIANVLFRYIRYALQSTISIATDYSHPDVLLIRQTAQKVGKEKHRMEAFIRFRKTKDALFYAVIQPDFNVLPLISKHFEDRYADQHWLIYDAGRKYGLYYDLSTVSEVKIDFSTATDDKASIDIVHDEREELYQTLWRDYFDSINIKARKNMKLHIQHMPKRYWRYLVEKQVRSDISKGN